MAAVKRPKRTLEALWATLAAAPAGVASVTFDAATGNVTGVTFFDKPAIVLPHQLPPQQELPAAPALPEVKDKHPLEGPLDMADLVLEPPAGMLAPAVPERDNN